VKGDQGEFQNVVRLGLVSFFTDVSSEMVFSILPMFIIGLSGGSVAVLGLIEGLAESLNYILRAVSGIISDRFRKRKLFILLGYSVSNIAKPFFAAAVSITDALIIRVVDRIGKGIRTAPRDALISDSVYESRRGEAFGLHRALDQSGAIIGPLTATLVMVFLGWRVRDVFWLSLLPGTMALLIILFGVKEIVGSQNGELKFLAGIREVVKGRFLWLLGIVCLFSLGAFNFSFILLNARKVGIGDALIPLVYMVVNVTHTLVAIPAGKLADKVGKERVLVLGYGVFLVSTFLLSSMPMIVASAYVVAATAYGIYYLAVGISFFVANTVVGSLWESQGIWASSLYSGTLATIAILGMLIYNRYSS
jgi:MFS family permease